MAVLLIPASISGNSNNLVPDRVYQHGANCPPDLKSLAFSSHLLCQLHIAISLLGVELGGDVAKMM